MLLNIYSLVLVAFYVQQGFASDCSISNGGCQHRCADIENGVVACQCNPGFQLNKDRQTCSDINECAMGNGGCTDVCENNPGSFRCSCTKGELSMNGFSCDVPNLQCHECDTYQENSGCEDPLIGDENLSGCVGATHCLKQKTTATKVDTVRKNGVYKRVVISRQCVNTPNMKNGCESYIGAGAHYTRCYCDTDGCNSSNVHTISILMLAFLLLLGLFMFH